MDAATVRSEEVSLMVTTKELADFSRRFGVRELSVFGSAITGAMSFESDIDLRVLFRPEAAVGYLTLGRMERELESMFGRRVDLIPMDGLKPAIRDEVLASARVLSAEE